MITIIFDVDDTLYDQMMPFRNAALQVFGDKCRGCMVPLYAAFRRNSDEVFDASQRGEITMEDMRVFRIQEAARESGFRITRERALLFQEAYGYNQNRISMSPTIKKVLDCCTDGGVHLGILTNGPSDHQRNKIRTLGADKWIPWERIYVSADIGISKPDPAAFRYVENDSGTVGEIYMVGDSYRNDISGAIEAGWKSIWLNHRRIKLGQNQRQPDHTADSEEKLLDIIQNVLKLSEGQENDGIFS